MAYDDDSHMEPHTHHMAQLTFNIDAVIIVLATKRKLMIFLQANSSFVIEYEKCLELKKKFGPEICFVAILIITLMQLCRHLYASCCKFNLLLIDVLWMMIE